LEKRDALNVTRTQALYAVCETCKRHTELVAIVSVKSPHLAARVCNPDSF
jgi:uncharacterized membrane protein